MVNFTSSGGGGGSGSGGKEANCIVEFQDLEVAIFKDGSMRQPSTMVAVDSMVADSDYITVMIDVPSLVPIEGIIPKVVDEDSPAQKCELARAEPPVDNDKGKGKKRSASMAADSSAAPDDGNIHKYIGSGACIANFKLRRVGINTETATLEEIKAAKESEKQAKLMAKTCAHLLR